MGGGIGPQRSSVTNLWRSGRNSVVGLVPGARAPHHRRMDEKWVTLGVMCMGLGGVVAGLVGVMLPEGRRLGAFFSLRFRGTKAPVKRVGCLPPGATRPSRCSG